MSKLRFLVAVVVLMALCGAVFAANICPNPGMENSNAGWKSGTWPDRWETNLGGMIGNEVYVWDTTNQRSGSKCISITNPTAGVFPAGNARTSGVRWISAADGLVLDGSKSYDIAVWVKKTSGVRVRLVYFWYSANKNAVIGTGSGAWEASVPVVPNPTTDWVQIHASASNIRPPFGAAYLEFALEIIPSAETPTPLYSTGTVYADDAGVTDYDSGLPAYGSLSGKVTYNSVGVANAIVGVKTTEEALTDGQYWAVTDASGDYRVYVPTPAPTTDYYAAAVKLPNTVAGETGYAAYSATPDYAFTVDTDTPDVTHNFALPKPLSQKLQLRAASIASGGANDIWRPCDGISAGGDRWWCDTTGAGDYLCMDLGANIPVSLINICQWWDQRAQDWTVDCSTDNINWTTLATAVGSTAGYINSSRWEIIRIPETSARYWRITRNTPTTAAWVVTEFELYSEISGTVQGQVKAGGVAFNKAIVGLKYRRADSASTGATLADADFYAVTDASGNYSVPVSNGTFDVAAWPHQDTTYPFVEAWAPTVAPSPVVVNGDTKTANINCVDGLGPNPSLAKTTDTTLVTASGDTGSRMGVFNGNRLDAQWNPGGGAIYGTMATGAYITRDFGASPPSIDTIVLSWAGNRANRQFAISYSGDNATWTPAYTAGYSNGGFPATSLLSRDGNWTIIRLSSAVTARYWRVTPLVRGSLYGYDWNGIRELELYKSTPPPGKISGTVTVGGTPVAGAYVGYKLASKGGYALADADGYLTTDVNGFYTTLTIPPGNYIVAAWPSTGDPLTEKYAMSDNVAVTVSGDKTVNFNITKGLTADYALTPYTPESTAALGSEGTWGNYYNGWHVVFDHSRYGGDYWNPATPGAWIYRDFGSNPPAIDTIAIGQGGGRYATSYVVETSDNASTWTTRYSEAAANGGRAVGDTLEMIKLAAPITARYWRLTGNTFQTTGQWWVSNLELYGTMNGLPGYIQGTVKVNGTLYKGAIVGTKTSAVATADADVVTHTNYENLNPADNYYFRTDSNGAFGPSLQLPYGTYKVAAYVEGYQTLEQTVTVNGNTTNLTFDLTSPIGFNKALKQPALDSVYASADRLVDGIRTGGDFWSQTQSSDPVTSPLWVRVDLSENQSINQILIQWVYGLIPSSYRIQYAVDDGSGIEPAPDDSVAWIDWYSTTATLGFVTGQDMYYWDRWDVVQKTAATGRWWRIWTNTGHPAGTNPQSWNMGIREMLVYSATDIPGKISGVVKTGGGAPIFNAIVRLEKTDGSMAPATIVTDTDGKYEFALLSSGNYTIAADALGYAPYGGSKTLAAGETWSNDVALTARSETGAFNGDMEIADGTLPAGWRAWPDNATDLDYYQYTGDKKSGLASFACNRSASATGGAVSAQSITADKWVSVTADKAYNIYLWAKSTPGNRGGAWSAIWRDASGNEITRLIAPGWGMTYVNSWRPYVLGYRAVPPSGAVYLDVHVIAEFGSTEDANSRLLIDDVVVDEATTPAIPTSNRIGEARRLPLGSPVALFSKIITGISGGDNGNGIPDGFIYLEERDRASGMLVGVGGIPVEQLPADLRIGQMVNVTGIIVNTRPETNDGEFAITADSLTRPDQGDANPLRPLSMTVQRASTASLAPGLLTAIVGYWSSDFSGYWIDDGSSSGKIPVSVGGIYLGAIVPPPDDGSFTRAVGIVGIDFSTGVRTLRIQRVEDIVGPYPP